MTFTALLAGASIAAAQGDKPDIRVTPTRVEFGKIDGVKSKRIMIQNKGKAELLVGSIEICSATSSEFSVTPSSATVAAKKKATVEISYEPADEGSDRGCLRVSSNDPDTPLVEVALSGSARTSSPEASPLRLRPTSADFGEVGIGNSSTIRVRVQSQGATVPQAVVNRCFETSDEFSFEPAVAFEVSRGGSSEISVTYSPEDVGDDEGCLEVRTGTPDDEAAVLKVRGAGVETPSDVDLDIQDFKVKKRVRVDLGQKIRVQLWVKNPGTVDEPRPARVTAEQNGATVYDEEAPVRDRIGNEGVTKHTFPSFTPTEVGDILWTATIEDDDSDVDQRLAATSVSRKPTPSDGVDLDIRRFSATSRVELGREPVRIRLKIRNNGSEDEPRNATVIGMQNGVEVYAETLSVSDAPGNQGSTVYKLPSYEPVAAGEILWMAILDDDDADLDEALAVTRVIER